MVRDTATPSNKQIADKLIRIVQMAALMTLDAAETALVGRGIVRMVLTHIAENSGIE